VVAARILADVGDVARFADRNRFASWTGTAPLNASSGELGDRGDMNHVVHPAVAGPRQPVSAPSRPRRPRLCLKRRISDAVYRQLVADAQHAADHDIARAREGTAGRLKKSSAFDSHPHIDTSDQPLPGPAPTTLRPAPSTRKRPLKPAGWTTAGSRKAANRNLMSTTMTTPAPDHGPCDAAAVDAYVQAPGDRS